MSDCRKTCAARRNENAECVCAELDEMEAAWPNGHLIVIEGIGLRRCDCRGMSASNPSHTALGIVTTDSLVAGRILAGRNPVTGVRS